MTMGAYIFFAEMWLYSLFKQQTQQHSDSPQPVPHCVCVLYKALSNLHVYHSYRKHSANYSIVHFIDLIHVSIFL